MKVFIAGPRAITKLDDNISTKLNNICKKNYSILIGDANGIDCTVQKFLNSKNYKNVNVYASNGIARNNIGNWYIKKVKVDNNIYGFKFYAQKDLEMAKSTDIGFMIWNGKSKGTFNNIINLLNLKKEVILYYTINQKFYDFKNFDDLYVFLNTNIKLSNTLKSLLPRKNNLDNIKQVCLF